MEGPVKPDLKKLRLARNWSQQLAAEYIGVSRSYLAMVEEGKRIPSIAAAKKIARILNFEWHIFFKDEDDRDANIRSG